jgi:hypothetical protein
VQVDVIQHAAGLDQQRWKGQPDADEHDPERKGQALEPPRGGQQMRQREWDQRRQALVFSGERQTRQSAGHERVARPPLPHHPYAENQRQRHHQRDQRVVDAEVRLADKQIRHRRPSGRHQARPAAAPTRAQHVRRHNRQAAQHGAGRPSLQVQQSRLGAELVDEVLSRGVPASDTPKAERRGILAEQQVLVEGRVGEGEPARQTSPDGERLENVRRLVGVIRLGQAEADAPQPQAQPQYGQPGH